MWMHIGIFVVGVIVGMVLLAGIAEITGDDRTRNDGSHHQDYE